MSNTKSRTLTRAVAALLLSLCPLSATSVIADDDKAEHVTWLGRSTPAQFNRYLPSSAFAQHMMLSQMRVSEIELGVIAMWVPEQDYPHTIFAASDDFEAYGFCSKRERVGCTMDVFDYTAGEIKRYHMSLAKAERRETYSALLMAAKQ